MAAFFLDHNVSRELAAHLRALGHVVQVAGELGLAREHDESLLLYAAKGPFVVVTHNTKAFVLLQRAWQLWSGDWGAPQQ